MSADSRDKAVAEGEAGRVSAGAHLRAEIRQLGLDQVAVSKVTGVSRQSVNNIVNGRQAISRAMAGKLGRLTGHTSDYWLSEYFFTLGAAHASAEAPRRAATSGILVNHQIVRALKDGIIGIAPFAAENLHAASIDLTLHETVTGTSGKRIGIGGKKGFALEPGRSVNASTRERVELPFDYLGRIGVVSRLAELGIIASHALQIEPGFKGRLRFCLHNAGAGTLHLRPLEPVISLEIVRLGTAPTRGGA